MRTVRKSKAHSYLAPVLRTAGLNTNAHLNGPVLQPVHDSGRLWPEVLHGVCADGSAAVDLLPARRFRLLESCRYASLNNSL